MHEAADRIGEGILFDDRWIGPHGIGRYAQELMQRLPGFETVPHTLRKLHPLEPLWLSAVIARAHARAYFTPGFNPPLISKIPVILTVHDLNHLVVKENSSSIRRSYYRYVVRPGCLKAFRVLTVSEFSRAQIVEWTGLSEERVVNVGCGISESFKPTGGAHAPGFPYVLYVGLRGVHKNISRLMQAFARARIDRSIHLLFTGDADKKLVEMAAGLGCADRLAFAGFPDDRNLAELYRGALALAMPSTFEGYGLPAVEAMACGTPALVSSAGGLAEACGNAGLAIESESVDSIADGLERIVSDASLRAELRVRGLAWAANFPWSGTAARVAAVLAELPRR
jgi:glycosyltransferase involved in cell wall biosynthesis